VPLWLMQLGEIVFGGVGSGIYGMLAFVLITVFIAGLMVGRTPEYLGKKIEAYEMKMVSVAILVMPAVVLIGTAIAVLVPSARASVANPGPHGFSEILYAFSSCANNNGSAFAGLNGNTTFYNTMLGWPCSGTFPGQGPHPGLGRGTGSEEEGTDGRGFALHAYARLPDPADRSHYYRRGIDFLPRVGLGPYRRAFAHPLGGWE